MTRKVNERYDLTEEWPTDGVTEPLYTFYAYAGEDMDPDGDGSLNNPFRCPNLAKNWIYNHVNCNGRQPKIQLCEGVYKQQHNMDFNGQLMGAQSKGGGPLIVRGIPEFRYDGTNWVPYSALAGMSTNGMDYRWYSEVTPFAFDLMSAGIIYGVSIDTPGTVGLYSTGGSKAETGCCSWLRGQGHMHADHYGSVFKTGSDYVHEGTDLSHMRATGQGSVKIIPGVYTMLYNNPHWGLAFTSADHAEIIIPAEAKFDGKSTGKRIHAIKVYWISTAGSVNNLPGDQPFNAMTDTDRTGYFD